VGFDEKELRAILSRVGLQPQVPAGKSSARKPGSFGRRSAKRGLAGIGLVLATLVLMVVLL
jgi:hypothetical protein